MVVSSLSACSILFIFDSLNRHEMDMDTMFDSRPPLDDLKSKVSQYLQMKKADVKATSERVKGIENQLASKDANRRMNL